MTLRIALRRFARGSRLLIGTSIGAGLDILGSGMIKLGGLLEGKRAKPAPAADSTEGILHQMQKYIDLWAATYHLKYQVGKENADDNRLPYPSREQYDEMNQLPPPFLEGDSINPAEYSYACNALGWDEAKILSLAEHDPRLVTNHLRIAYWEQWHKSQSSPENRS